MLVQNGEQIATVSQGSRFHATVCTPGNYEFVIRKSWDDLVPKSQTITIEPGKSYYVKIHLVTSNIYLLTQNFSIF